METLEDIMYHEPRPVRVRKEPMQVLALGLSRSGTESLREALLHLGYNHTYHGFDVPNHDTEAWVRLGRRKFGIGARAKAALKANGYEPAITAADFDAIIGHCTAVTDMPTAAFPLEMIAAYPDAKVILNQRKDLDAWHKSMTATFAVIRAQWKKYFRSFFNAQEHWLRCIFEETFDGYFQGGVEFNGKRAYREHLAKIRGAVPEENLLEWTVEDGWEPLCRFLGKSTSNLPEFPRGNAPEEFLKKVVAETREREISATRNMVITGSVVTALLGVLVWAVTKKA